MGEDICKWHVGKRVSIQILIKLNTQKTQIIQWRNRQKTWTDTFPKKTSRWQTDTWKDAHHSSSRKYKSKPRWDTTSHLSEWLKWTTQETIDNRWGCRERGTLLHCWWECRLVQPLWKTVWRCLKTLQIELSYDPAIALLGIYPRDTGVLMHRGTCTPMFIAVL